MTSSLNTTTIETQQIQQQQQQQAIESTGTTIMNTNSNNNSDRSISNSNIKSSIITPNTKKEVSFENTENIVFIEYEQCDNNIDELWYTNSELQKCRNDYIRNMKSHHRYKKRQEMKNRVEIAWRSSRLFIIKYKKIRKPVYTTRLQLKNK